MRAARIHRYGPPEVLQVEEVPEPRAGTTDVVVAVDASSVNPVDVKIRAGLQRGVIRYRLPWILGLDVAGSVVSVGQKVTRFRKGDRVFGSPTHRRPGCYAEFVAIDETMLARVPAGLDAAGAASLPLVGLTAWASLVDFAGLRSGERVLIQAGAGGVGSFAIQLAKALGAHVTATASSRNLELCRELGADAVIDYTRQDFTASGERWDVVLDTLGGEQQRRALAVLRRGGRLPSVVAGIPDATKQFGPNLGVPVALLRMLGLTVGARMRRGVKARNVMRPSDGRRLESIAELVQAGKIRPLLDSRFPLADIAEAHRRSETGRARGKIVIDVR